jgi:hypothetical protein
VLPLAISTTSGVAFYAAVIATGGLAVQVVREWRTWGTRVTVEMRPMTVTQLSSELPEPVVLFTITNHSDHVAKITHLSVAPIKNGGKSLWFPRPLPQGTPGPWAIEPHDHIDLYQPVDSFADGEPSVKTRARVTTADGKTVKSKRVLVRDLLDLS